MSDTMKDIFFYGLFMDESVLRAKGVEPRLPRRAVVRNYQLGIGQRAMLCPQPSAKAFGMVYALNDAEIDSLYGEPGLEMYRPESVVATFEDGSSSVVTTYNLPDTVTDEPNLEYAAKLRVVLERLGFPNSFSMDEVHCVFCKLLAGELEVSLIHEDDVCSAFMDIQPVNPGHALVVPNRHAPYLADLDEHEGAQMFRVAQRIAAALRKCELKCQGVNFFLADGEAAGQEVFHVHLHIFPRYSGDGFRLSLPPHYQHKPAREELNNIAQRIRVALQSTY